MLFRSQEVHTIIFNTVRHGEYGNLLFYQVANDINVVHQIMNALYELNIQSVLVVGGAKLLQSFINEGTWDEARVISNMQMAIGNGLPAPELGNALKIEEKNIFSDKIEIHKPKDSS